MIDSLNYWTMELKGKAPATQQRYQYYFSKFCKFTGKTPNELIEKRHSDLKQDDPREQREIENILRDYANELKAKGKSPATQQIAYAAVKSFFDTNEYPLRIKKSEYPTGESMGSRVITKQLIKQILDDTNHFKHKNKTKALIFFLKDTGLSASDVSNLVYGQVREGLEKNWDFIPISLLRQKTKTITKTFIGPEAVEALKIYIAERRTGTQRIPPEILTDKSPLFRVNKANSTRKISRGCISSMMRFHCLRTGVPDLSAHSFRKYVQTNLDVAGISPNLIDRILGHKLGHSRDPYSQPSDEELLKAYKGAYSALRVYPDKAEINQRFNELESEVSKRDRIIAQLLTDKQNRDELNQTQTALVKSLMARLEELEKKMEKNR